jgi:deaminated glutathione amidase
VKAGLLQLRSSDDPAANLPRTLLLVAEAAAQGAEIVLTPEVTNCVSASRSRQQAVLAREEEDATLAALREAARAHGVWLLAGSLAVKTGDPDGRFANRSLLLAPDGEVAARYDKIHMFDVEVSETETYRESAGYRPGDRAVVARTPLGRIGMSVCYDLRFPHLYRALAQAGAEVLTVPSAFSPVTGAAHWEPLLRARAIETGCFVLAPAQSGRHAAERGRARETWGHGMAVAPWGEVILDMGVETGAAVVDLDMAEVGKARRRVPSLAHDRPFDPPQGRTDAVT